jgi:hypothetical protein
MLVATVMEALVLDLEMGLFNPTSVPWLTGAHLEIPIMTITRREYRLLQDLHGVLGLVAQ